MAQAVGATVWVTVRETVHTVLVEMVVTQGSSARNKACLACANVYANEVTLTLDEALEDHGRGEHLGGEVGGERRGGRGGSSVVLTLAGLYR